MTDLASSWPGPEVISMRTRDGVRLDADMYRPEGNGPFPTLLMRQPYGRRIASTVTYAHPAWYCACGYLVVIQDVRGRGTSEGHFEPFVNEAVDGEDTLKWLTALPDCDGNIGMYGFSYQGVTQLFAAASGHPALKTITPAMAGFRLYHDWAYESGAFRLYSSLSWAAQLGAESDRRDGNHQRFTQRYRLGHGPDAAELIDPASPAMRDLLADTFYGDWLERPQDDEYWTRCSPSGHLPSLNIPALHIGGWFDSFLTGTLAGFDYYRDSRHCQRLVIGPWAHIPWTPSVGGVWLGESAQSQIDLLQLRWFDRFLKKETNGVDHEAPVMLFDLRSGRWRDFDDYRSSECLRLHPGSDGRAAVDVSAGTLSEHVADEMDDFLVHDPWRPVPTVGGHLAPSSGIQDRTAVDARLDVITYTTAPLDQTILLAGPVRAWIHAIADADSFDLSAVLAVVDKDGRARNLTQGYSRGGVGTRELDLRGTCALIRPGERLRLSVSGACYPAYTLNDGRSRRPSEVRASDYPIITIRVNTCGSWLELPIRILKQEQEPN